MGENSKDNSFLPWSDIEPHAALWHKESIEYLTQIWPDISNRMARSDTWGDEVECQIVHFDDTNQEVQLSLKQKDILRKLEDAPPDMFHPEFARYMIETTPPRPYDGGIDSLLSVEINLKQRRAMIQQKLDPNEKLMTISLFPRLGVEPLVQESNSGDKTRDHDEAISDGPYGLAKQNIEARSKRSTNIKVPIYQDAKTKLPHTLLLRHILFGPGACGLQATFQCRTLDDARLLHDQLTVLGPIFLALTAATPIYQGILVDTDVRWNQTTSAVDDRPDEELNQLQARWATAPMYLQAGNKIPDSDRGLEPQTEALGRPDAELLESKGMDQVMARYFANLHLRDPLYLAAKGGKHEKVTAEAVHRSICASVWSHVRLKVPEPDSKDQGWRVEFRPMEVQPTDFANASFLIFLDLIRQTMAWLGSDLDLWMPLALVRENMERSHTKNAILDQKFWFPEAPIVGSSLSNGETKSKERRSVLMTVDEIINGSTTSKSAFPGLLPLIRTYLDRTSSSATAKRQDLERYLGFISNRASGKDLTPAQWMRQFVQEHPLYGKDSMVGAQICHDMLRKLVEMTPPHN